MGLLGSFFSAVGTALAPVRDVVRGVGQIAAPLISTFGGPGGQIAGALLAQVSRPSGGRAPLAPMQRPLGGSTLPPARQPPPFRTAPGLQIPPTFRPFGTTFRGGRFPPQVTPFSRFRGPSAGGVIGLGGGFPATFSRFPGGFQGFGQPFAPSTGPFAGFGRGSRFGGLRGGAFGGFRQRFFPTAPTIAAPPPQIAPQIQGFRFPRFSFGGF